MQSIEQIKSHLLQLGVPKSLVKNHCAQLKAFRAHCVHIIPDNVPRKRVELIRRSRLKKEDGEDQGNRVRMINRVTHKRQPWE